MAARPIRPPQSRPPDHPASCSAHAAAPVRPDGMRPIDAPIDTARTHGARILLAAAQAAGWLPPGDSAIVSVTAAIAGGPGSACASRNRAASALGVLSRNRRLEQPGGVSGPARRVVAAAAWCCASFPRFTDTRSELTLVNLGRKCLVPPPHPPEFRRRAVGLARVGCGVLRVRWAAWCPLCWGVVSGGAGVEAPLAAVSGG